VVSTFFGLPHHGVEEIGLPGRASNFWSGHAQTHVLERSTKLLQDSLVPRNHFGEGLFSGEKRCRLCANICDSLQALDFGGLEPNGCLKLRGSVAFLPSMHVLQIAFGGKSLHNDPVVRAGRGAKYLRRIDYLRLARRQAGYPIAAIVTVLPKSCARHEE
jgi:hypothetical protein